MIVSHMPNALITQDELWRQVTIGKAKSLEKSMASSEGSAPLWKLSGFRPSANLRVLIEKLDFEISWLA